MYQSKILHSNGRAQQLRAYGIADPHDRLHRAIYDTLMREVGKTAAIYADHYIEITGIRFDERMWQAFIDKVKTHLRIKYSPPYNEAWIAKCEKIAELIYSSHTDPAAHLAALSASKQHEIRTVFQSAESADAGSKMVVELQRFYSLEAAIMLTVAQQCREREHRSWIEKQVDVFRRAVTEAVERAAGRSEDGKKQADQANNLTRDLLTLADEVSVASRESATAMGNAAQTAGELRVTLDEMNTELSRATEVLCAATGIAEDTQQTVEELTSQSASIQSIAQMIKSITSQTSILALNARIEAARAGEAGRGFSVVASEIKGLSEQTAKATEEIVERLGGIEQASDRALHANCSMHKTFVEVCDLTQTVCSEVTEQTNIVTQIAASVDETSLAAASSSEAVLCIRGLVDGISQEMGATTELASDLNGQIAGLKDGAEAFLQSLHLTDEAAALQPIEEPLGNPGSGSLPALAKGDMDFEDWLQSE
ncbi:MAG: methyl-accepting chemotaxis protein [Pseudomonadota bacterium]